MRSLCLRMAVMRLVQPPRNALPCALYTNRSLRNRIPQYHLANSYATASEQPRDDAEDFFIDLEQLKRATSTQAANSPSLSRASDQSSAPLSPLPPSRSIQPGPPANDDFFLNFDTTPGPFARDTRDLRALSDQRVHEATEEFTDEVEEDGDVEEEDQSAWLTKEVETPRAMDSFPGSGSMIIKEYLEEAGFMGTQEIWDKATNGLKPIQQAAFGFQPDGRIRLKRVSTMREGKRPYVPPKSAPMPFHPFRSVRFLKTTLLSSLESQELIRKTWRLRPPKTQAEFDALVKHATRLTIRREAEAMRKGLPPPAAHEPAMTIREWGWCLANAPTDDYGGIGDNDYHKKPGYGPPSSYAWDRARKLEEQLHKSRAGEADNRRRRLEIRKTLTREARATARAEKAEIIALGRGEEVAKEMRRQRAIFEIGRYARVTGEDVSGWLDELESGELGEVPEWKFKHKTQGGGRPRPKNIPWLLSQIKAGRY